MIKDSNKLNKVIRTERGWAGHFICAADCLFRRNTLLEYNDIKIVVSTVGLMRSPWGKGSELYKGSFEEIGIDRYYETMAFHSNKLDTRFHDIDVSRQIDFDSQWSIDRVDADDLANDMHEKVVAELTTRLQEGEFDGDN